MEIAISGYTSKIVEFSVTASLVSEVDVIHKMFSRNVFVESVSARRSWNTNNNSTHIPEPVIVIGYYEMTPKGNKSSKYQERQDCEKYTTIPSDVIADLKNAYYAEAKKQVSNAMVGA